MPSSDIMEIPLMLCPCSSKGCALWWKGTLYSMILSPSDVLGIENINVSVTAWRFGGCWKERTTGNKRGSIKSLQLLGSSNSILLILQTAVCNYVCVLFVTYHGNIPENDMLKSYCVITCDAKGFKKTIEALKM